MSVFTYIHHVPRVSSPWLGPADGSRKPPTGPRAAITRGPAHEALLSEYGVTKLQAEPQDGPTEYKLHLLLRQRRKYRSMSTTTRIAGSQQARPAPAEAARPAKQTAAPVMAPSNQTRQSRLLQLTSQLFWRLQQSSPYHASASPHYLIPQLPDDSADLTAALEPGPMLQGIEESRGALYEIGVADDGTLAGLTKDELDESVLTLRVMAASLGCKVEVLRTVRVGSCEWAETPEQLRGQGATPRDVVHEDDLWVSEALVTPLMGARSPGGDHSGGNGPVSGKGAQRPGAAVDKGSCAAAEQLRVTVTGPTTSGKSTLLGTLSTGNLDNGYGKSRVDLLKHPHELESGMTSSVAQELIGYKDGTVFNYTHGNIETWVNIHDHTKDGRLVFLSDSAGHPRYRRTILRGLVGWAPHWTLLCIAVDDAESGPGQGPGQGPGPAPAPGPGAPAAPSQDGGLDAAPPGVDLARAHLELCLRLRMPLAVIVTKFDLATKASVQRTVGKILSGIKAAGRTPRILPQPTRQEPNRTTVPPDDDAAVRKVVASMAETGDLLSAVPIIFTSAVKGTGIGLVHALLQNLPLPPPPAAHDYIGMALNPEQPACLFHVEDKFGIPASYGSVSNHPGRQADMGVVVAGYMRFGSLSVGHHILVGPFPSEDDGADARGLSPEGRSSPASYGLSLSHPSSGDLARGAARNAVSASAIKGEWHGARVVSIRNLRLSVQTLEAGQVGTVGIVLDLPPREQEEEEEGGEDDEDRASPDGIIFERPAPPTPPTPKIRKGMVLAMPGRHMVDTGRSLQAASGLTASFRDADATNLTAGCYVNVYVASVRAAARILKVSPARREAMVPGPEEEEEAEDMFRLNEQMEGSKEAAAAAAAAAAEEEEDAAPDSVDVQLELLTNREWIELGSQVLILAGGAKDRSGLEGYVGRVVEIVD